MSDTQFRTALSELLIELEPDEITWEIIHKHWGKILMPLIGISIALIISFVFIITIIFKQQPNFQLALTILSLGTLWFIALVGYGLSEWQSYNKSAIIITSQRLIDCQQHTFLTRKLQVIDIHEIQSCSGEVAPTLGLLFNYGNLTINTIGTDPIIIAYMPNPEASSALIMHYHNLVAHKQLNESEHARLDSSESLPIITNDKDKQTLLMFHLPSENYLKIKEQLPAQKEPSVVYLKKMDYYEVEIIIPTNNVSQVVDWLKSNCAEDIVGRELEVFDND